MANYFCFDKSCLSGFSLKANSYDDYRTGVAISFQLFKLYYPVCNEIFQSCMLLCIFCQSNVIEGHRSLGQISVSNPQTPFTTKHIENLHRNTAMVRSRISLGVEMTQSIHFRVKLRFPQSAKLAST